MAGQREHKCVPICLPFAAQSLGSIPCSLRSHCPALQSSRKWGFTLPFSLVFSACYLILVLSLSSSSASPPLVPSSPFLCFSRSLSSSIPRMPTSTPPQQLYRRCPLPLSIPTSCPFTLSRFLALISPPRCMYLYFALFLVSFSRSLPLLFTLVLSPSLFVCALLFSLGSRRLLLISLFFLRHLVIPAFKSSPTLRRSLS